MAIHEVKIDRCYRKLVVNSTLFTLFAITFVISVPPCIQSQEYAYYSKPVNAGDTDPETFLEDVNTVLEYYEPPGTAVTALATVYPAPNVTDGVEAPPKDIRVSCLNVTHDMVVEIFNSTASLMSSLVVNPDVKDRSTPSNCTIILFYARWCPFSAKAAPHFNALPRVFPSLKTAAIDATLHTSVNTYFGILSVPTIMVFRNGKLVAKFNESVYSLAKIVDFISSVTDLQVAPTKVNVTSQDFHGPLPSSPTKDFDLYLYLGWIFIGICFVNYARKSQLFKTIIEFVRITWREAEAQHEHQD